MGTLFKACCRLSCRQRDCMHNSWIRYTSWYRIFFCPTSRLELPLVRTSLLPVSSHRFFFSHHPFLRSHQLVVSVNLFWSLRRSVLLTCCIKLLWPFHLRRHNHHHSFSPTTLYTLQCQKKVFLTVVGKKAKKKQHNTSLLSFYKFKFNFIVIFSIKQKRFT